MKTLSIEKMEQVEGGIPPYEYCTTLWNLLTGGGYQGDVTWGWTVFNQH